MVLEAGEMAATRVAEEMDLVAGLDILNGAKQNEGKTTRDISGGTLHLRSIRAGMTFQRRNLFIIPFSGLGNTSLGNTALGNMALGNTALNGGIVALCASLIWSGLP